MNVFLKSLSEAYKDDLILLAADQALWHRSGGLAVSENIRFIFIPPYTPEMNPIKQIWSELRKRGFRNEIFATLNDVAAKLCETICGLTKDDIMSITHRDWIPAIY